MFRDRDEELERLNRELLEEEDEDEEYEEDEDEEYEDEEYEEEEEYEEDEEYEEAEQPVYHAYNTDTADVDLDRYSEEVYTAPRHGCSFAILFMLMVVGVLLFLAYLLAKKEGLL